MKVMNRHVQGAQNGRSEDMEKVGFQMISSEIIDVGEKEKEEDSAIGWNVIKIEMIFTFLI